MIINEVLKKKKSSWHFVSQMCKIVKKKNPAIIVPDQKLYILINIIEF